MNYFSRMRGAKTPSELRAQFYEDAAEFERKALHRINKFGNADQRAFAKRLLAGALLDGAVVGSAAVPRWAFQRLLYKEYRKRIKADPVWEVRLVTVLLPQHATSDERTVINVRKVIADSHRIASQMTPHFVGLIELQVMANVRHPDGGKEMWPHAHIPILACDKGDRAYEVAQRVNARLGPLPNGLKPVHISEACPDKMSLARLMAYGPKLPARNKTLYLNPESGKANLHESTKGDRYIRYERQFELLSSLRLRDLAFAGGDCRAIKTAALHAAQRAAWLAFNNPEKLARSALSTFWAEWRAQTNSRRFMPSRVT